MKNEKGLAKFIDVCAKGLGKVYEPIHLVRMAKAEAKSMKLLAEAARNTSDVPMKINFEDTSFSTELETKEVQELCERAIGRDLYFQMVKQRNIESVIGKAYTEIENEEIISEEPVEQDWILRFFSCAEEISDDDMQTLWAKVLAGEIKKPKSYSLRTLETLRNLTIHEAKLFERICSNVVFYNGEGFLPNDPIFLRENLIDHSDILSMQDAGLLMVGTNSMYSIFVEIDGQVFINNENLALIIKRKRNGGRMELKCYPLTLAGVDLASIINAKHTDEFVFSLANYLKELHPNTSIQVNKVDKIEDSYIWTTGKNLLK